jgi:hypothetical protein
VASEDLEARIRARGAKAAAKDIDRVSKSTKKLDKSADRAGRSGIRAGAGFRTMGGGLRPMVGLMASGAAALGGMGLAGAATFAVKAASDLSEEINKSSVVFKGHEEGVLRWSKNAADAFGQSRTQALAAAGGMGSLLVPMGVARDDAAKMSMRMTELGSDMASFNNASPEEALQALKSGLSGESEPLRRFGVDIRDAALQEFALSKGIKRSVSDMGSARKSQLIYSKVLNDTKDQQGDFARTSGSLANSQRTLKAQVTDLAASMGKSLEPMARKVVAGLAGFVKGIQNGTGAGGRFRSIVTGIGRGFRTAYNAVSDFVGAVKSGNGPATTLAAVLIVLGGVVAIAAIRSAAMAVAGAAAALGTSAWAAATWVLNGALAILTSPIGLIIIAIGLLIGALVMAYRKSDTFKRIVDGVWGAIKSAAGWVGRLAGKLKGPLSNALKWILDKFQAVWDLVSKFTDLGPIGAVLDFASSQLGGDDKGPGKAAGGLIGRSGPYTVGERGTERVFLPQGAYVEPHGGGGEAIVHANLYVDGEKMAGSVTRAALRKKARR